MVSGEQPSDQISRQIEILSFPSLSERGPLLTDGSGGADLLKKWEWEGKEEWKGGGESPESPHFIDGTFWCPFPLTPVLVQERVNTRIWLRSNLWSLTLSERVLQENRISYWAPNIRYWDRMAPTSSPPVRTARASYPAYGSSGEGPFLCAW